MAPASRIIFSAAWSSSSVVTPGRTIRRTASRTSATSRPAARIFSSSLLDFPIIKLFTTHCFFDICIDRLDVAGAVHAAEAAGALVVFEQRLRLALVGLKPRH